MQNAERIFRFLFISIALPATEQTRDRVASFAGTLKKGNPALMEVQKELSRLTAEVGKMQEQRQQIHQ
jgi:hypothetical protein